MQQTEAVHVHFKPLHNFSKVCFYKIRILNTSIYNSKKDFVCRNDNTSNLTSSRLQLFPIYERRLRLYIFCTWDYDYSSDYAFLNSRLRLHLTTINFF